MTPSRKANLLFPLLALSIILVTATTARAQYRDPQRTRRASVSLRVSFGTRPSWTSISGTRVEEVTSAGRPGYDVFRYGGSYYAYDNNRWYMSRRQNGNFAMIDNRNVPGELTRIPRDHWRNYPSDWLDANGNPRYHDRNHNRYGDRNSQTSGGGYQH